MSKDARTTTQRRGTQRAPSPAAGTCDHDFVDMTEISKRANKSLATVQWWRIKRPDFPPPYMKLTIGPIWEWPAVRDWIAQMRKPGRPPKIPATPESRPRAARPAPRSGADV